MEENTLQIVRESISEILDHLCIPYDGIEVEEQFGKIIRVNINTEKAPFLIGTFGERVNALQQISKGILWKRGVPREMFVIIDVDNYKKSREEKMIALAEEKAEAAKETNIAQTMPPLEPYLRRIIHLHFTQEQFSGFSTESVGEERVRRIQICWGTASDDIGE